jgi:hypothetical protein
MDSQTKRAGNYLCDKIAMLLTCFEHLMRFSGVASHAGFHKNVLPRLQRRDRDFTVQIRPRTDDHSVNFLVSDKILPAAKRFGDSEFVSGGSG